MFRRSILSLACTLPSVSFGFTIPTGFFQNDAYDVVVIGAGAAGLSAAVEAAELGSSVLVLEKATEIGGNTLISGGFYSSVDPKRQKAQGIADSQQFFFEQTFKYGGEHGDKKLILHMVENAQNSLEWLEKLGMHFQKNVFELYGSHWPRSHFPVLPLGQGYIRVLSAAALKRGVKILTSAQMTKLIREGKRVTGVVANIGGETRIIKAKKGVVIASGSFAANSELVSRFSPQLSGLTTNNTPWSTGEAMMAATEVGASLVDMNYIQCLPGCPPGKKYRVRFHNDVSSFIFVNDEGKRFIREDARRDELRDAILALPQKHCFIIIDNQGFKKAGILVQKEAVLALEGGEAWRAKTVGELASKLGVNPENLKTTIEKYNQGVRARNDVLGKVITDFTLELREPPFWASYSGMTIHYTEGGLKINEKAECLDGNGKPIPGLFAAGAVTGGVHGKNRLGGNGLPDAVVFGRTAGRTASLQE